MPRPRHTETWYALTVKPSREVHVQLCDLLNEPPNLQHSTPSFNKLKLRTFMSGGITLLDNPLSYRRPQRLSSAIFPIG